MQQHFASLTLAALVLAAISCTVSSADPLHYLPGNDHLRQGYGGQVEILVNGTVQPRYAHQGRWYVEAFKGREYAIRLRNPYPVRVAVALSVDGLNTIDARHTAAKAARKWLIDPYDTITISGWQVSSSHARKFEFTTEEQSYGAALGKTANLGMISAVYFRERVARTTMRHQPEAPSSAPQAAAESVGDSQARRSSNEYAATGMGQRTDHAVTEVSIDLEDAPAQTVNIRYEYRAQLVRLGILPARTTPDPLARREKARGFEGGFAPEVR